MRQYGEDIAVPVGNQPANRECQHDPNLLWSPSTRPVFRLPERIPQDGIQRVVYRKLLSRFQLFAGNPQCFFFGIGLDADVYLMHEGHVVLDDVFAHGILRKAPREHAHPIGCVLPRGGKDWLVKGRRYQQSAEPRLGVANGYCLAGVFDDPGVNQGR